MAERLRSPVPPFSRAQIVGEACSVINERSPALLVLLLPNVAHLGRCAGPGTAVVADLDEGWERHRWDWLATIPPLRRRALEALQRWRSHALYTEIGRTARAVVAISDEEATRFGRWIDRDRIHVIPHGVDLQMFYPPSGEGAHFDVGIFGDFRYNRNSEPALRLLEQAATAGPPASEWRWVLAGRSERDELTSRLPARARDSVTVTGFVDDLAAMYRRCAVIAIPGEGETGVKTTLLEAWATGLPVVSTHTGARGVRARAGENLLLAPPERFLDEIRRLLESEPLREELSRRALESARDHDVRRQGERFAELCVHALRGDKVV